MNARQHRKMLLPGNRLIHLAFIRSGKVLLLCGFGAVAAAAAVAPVPLTVRDDWGAFADEALGRCWAVARPEPDGRVRGDAAATVLVLRGRGAPQLQLRLVRPARSASMSIDGRSVRLVGQDRRWWPAAGDNAAAVAALRGGRAMQLVAAGFDGRAIRHRFRLAGAATAIDAAILGCAPRRPVANPPQ